MQFAKIDTVPYAKILKNDTVPYTKIVKIAILALSPLYTSTMFDILFDHKPHRHKTKNNPNPNRRKSNE